MSPHDEVVGLVGSLGRAVHDGDVPANPSYPYLLVNSRVQAYPFRSLAHSRQGVRRSWLVTPAAQSQESVRDLIDLVFSLDGERVQGQRLEVRGVGIDIEEEENLRVNNLPVFFSKLELLLTLPS